MQNYIKNKEIEEAAKAEFRKRHGFGKKHYVDTYAEFQEYEPGFKAGAQWAMERMKKKDSNSDCCDECGARYEYWTK